MICGRCHFSSLFLFDSASRSILTILSSVAFGMDGVHWFWPYWNRLPSLSLYLDLLLFEAFMLSFQAQIGFNGFKCDVIIRELISFRFVSFDMAYQEIEMRAARGAEISHQKNIAYARYSPNAWTKAIKMQFSIRRHRINHERIHWKWSRRSNDENIYEQFYYH